MSNDIVGSGGTVKDPLAMPPICRFCDIPIYDGFDHSRPVGCFKALQAYVKVYQDELEKSRIEAFSNPPQKEVISDLKFRLQTADDITTNCIAFLAYCDDIATVRSVIGSYLQSMLGNVRLTPYVVHLPGAPIVLTLEPGANIDAIMAHLSSRRAGHNNTEEGTGNGESSSDRDPGDPVRSVLPSDVSDQTEDMDQARKERQDPENHLGA